MADTVKKSRIVSDDGDDDNLEEALMEEFNQRLKNCMSQDNLFDDDDDTTNDIITNEPHYEQVEIIKPVKIRSDPNTEFINHEQENYYEEPRWPPTSVTTTTPTSTTTNGTSEIKTNGHHYDESQRKQPILAQQEDEEAIYENVTLTIQPQTNNEKTDDLCTDQYVAMTTPITTPANHEEVLVKTEDDNVKVTKTSEDNNSNRIYEEMSPKATSPTAAITPTPPITTTTNLSGDNDNDDDERNIPIIAESNIESSSSDQMSSSGEFGKSVKDRMLLSTDVAPCLLFTQTVTSPMLTPSEENIDFLKGFRRESTASAPTSNTNSKDESSSSPVGEQITDLDEPKETEIIYENTEYSRSVPNQERDEIIYENLKAENYGKEPEKIYQNLLEVTEDGDGGGDGDSGGGTINEGGGVVSEPEPELARTTNELEEEIEGHIYQDIEDVSGTEIDSGNSKAVGVEETKPIVELVEEVGGVNGDVTMETVKITEIDSCNSLNNINLSGGDRIPEKIVENLKCQFQEVTTNNVTNFNRKEKVIEDVQDLKSVDIIKQINRFERKYEEPDDTTQVTEYVETTTVETKSDGKGLKKKKTKKSRKEEKENISVNGTNSNNHIEENVYNVNVKSLCRSFGDLTKLEPGEKAIIQDGQQAIIKNHAENRTREKFYAYIGDSSNDKKCCNNHLKSSFSKFDALQKKNVLHIRSSDSSKAQEKFNGAQVDSSNCRACEKAVFQMEQIKAEKSIWHRNCFRCKECNKQLNVDTYQSHEGTLYCKPHFRALFAPKAVDEENNQPKPRKAELIIRENQPAELPPDVVRASDKPDLGLEELQSLNVKERFQVFEHYQNESNELERVNSAVNVKRSPSILSKLARFQAKGMDIGVSDDALNGIPIEESSSEEEVIEDDEGLDGEDADLIRAKRVQKEKPFHFTGMSDVKSKWEMGEQNASRDERREERKQEIQSIRNRLFMGKQGKMKEAYQQAVMESESCTNLRKEPIEITDTKSLKEKFEKGELTNEKDSDARDREEEEVYESEISKKSRSLFLELDANASKPPQITPIPTPKLDVKKAREAYLSKMTSEEVVKSTTERIDEVPVPSADIQERYKFFETYKAPEKQKKTFRITPPREGQVKGPTPDREVYRDPDIVRSEEYIEDSVVAKQSHTATKMLNKFRQMEENLSKEPTPQGPKPLKRFTPPPEPTRPETSSEDGSEDDEDEEEGDEDEDDRGRIPDEDLLEAQKAARAKHLRAKFERWEANEIKKEQSSVNIAEEFGEDQSQIESTRTIRARFESMREPTSDDSRAPRVKVNRFVDIPNVVETCESCQSRVYPLEKISVHGHIYHKTCFKCMECSCVLRMDSYSYNQGLLYCMPHFKRLFISKGNYDTGFGLGQRKEKWNATLA